MDLSRRYLWRKLRERKILRQHARVVDLCERLIQQYRTEKPVFPLAAKKTLGTDRIIWQYWAQGYDDVPPIVRECLDSVERYAGEYKVIRLTDDNLADYLDLPDFVQEKRGRYSRTFFSDLLRLALLKVYGGVWLDATVLLSAPVPEQLADAPFFAYRRDPSAPHQEYWRNTYAYYFGWVKGFRVNILSSILAARPGNRTVSELCDLLLLWWRENDSLPDYFLLQILFDVYGAPEGMPLMSDTFPHYLQQFMNDPNFNLMSREKILSSIPIHKLSYKKEL